VRWQEPERPFRLLRKNPKKLSAESPAVNDESEVSSIGDVESIRNESKVADPSIAGGNEGSSFAAAFAQFDDLPVRCVVEREGVNSAILEEGIVGWCFVHEDRLPQPIIGVWGDIEL